MAHSAPCSSAHFLFTGPAKKAKQSEPKAPKAKKTPAKKEPAAKKPASKRLSEKNLPSAAEGISLHYLLCEDVAHELHAFTQLSRMMFLHSLLLGHPRMLLLKVPKVGYLLSILSSSLAHTFWSSTDEDMQISPTPAVEKELPLPAADKEASPPVMDQGGSPPASPLPNKDVSSSGPSPMDSGKGKGKAKASSIPVFNNKSKL